MFHSSSVFVVSLIRPTKGCNIIIIIIIIIIINCNWFVNWWR